MIYYCIQCGKPTEQNANYCTNCGALIAGREQPRIDRHHKRNKILENQQKGKQSWLKHFLILGSILLIGGWLYLSLPNRSKPIIDSQPVVEESTRNSEIEQQMIDIPSKPTYILAAEYIDYFKTIQLTSEQRKIKDSALTSIPAPCCSNYPIATCCCPCNLAKSVWGLSNFLIAKNNYGVQQVKGAISKWIQFTNHRGYTGDACFTGGCNKPFEQNGCGGMDARNILRE